MTTNGYRDEKWAWGLVAAWTAASAIVAFDSLPLPNVAFAQDLGVMVDAGWRFYQGQRTHADFHSAIGPVLGMLFGIPMLIAGPSYESLHFLPFFVSAITAGWSCAMLRGLLHPWSRAAVAVAIGAGTGGIHHLGFPPELLTFATFYNRVGFGLLAIGIIAALLPRGQISAVHGFFLDSSALIAAVVLVFLKVNFAIPAAIAVALSAAMYRRSRTGLWQCSAVVVIVSIALLASIGFRVDRMLGDILMAADARRNMLDEFFFPFRNTLANLDFIILLSLYTLTILPLGQCERDWWRRFRCHATVVWVPFIVGLLITLSQSHGDGRGVLTALSGLAISLAWLEAGASAFRLPSAVKTVGLFRPEDRQAGCNTAHGLRWRTLNGLVIAMALLFIVPHAQSYARWFQISQSIAAQQFAMPAIRTLLVGGANNWGDRFPSLANEACDLLARECAPDASLQYIDVSNIFNFACRLRSPKQSPLWWDAATYSKNKHPGVEVFGDTEFLLLPKSPMSSRAIEQWLDIYGPTVEDEFILKAESANFRLLRRK